MIIETHSYGNIVIIKYLNYAVSGRPSYLLRTLVLPQEKPFYIFTLFILVSVIWSVDQTLLNTHHDKIRVLGFLGFDAMPFSKWFLTFEGSQCLHLKDLAVLLGLLHSKNEDSDLTQNQEPLTQWLIVISQITNFYTITDATVSFHFMHQAVYRTTNFTVLYESMRLLGTIHTQNWLHLYLKGVHKKKLNLYIYISVFKVPSVPCYNPGSYFLLHREHSLLSTTKTTYLMMYRKIIDGEWESYGTH